jgi:hypothetical protein
MPAFMLDFVDQDINWSELEEHFEDEDEDEDEDEEADE